MSDRTLTLRSLGRMAIPAGLVIVLAACSRPTDQVRPVLVLGNETVQAGGGKFYDLGKEHFAAARFGLAAAAFQAALAQDRTSVPVLNALAATYDRLGRFELADRHYREALVLAPKDSQTLNNFGYSLLLRGETARAAEVLAEARQLAPEDAVIAANLEHTEKVRVRRVGGSQRASAAEAAPPPPPPPLWIERESETVQTLVTAGAELAKAAQEAGVDPRVLGSQGLRETVAAAPREPVAATPLPALPREPIREQAQVAVLAPADPRPSAPPAREAERAAICRIEVANGAGRTRMAARMREHLAARELAVTRLTNDASFAHPTTVIFYRDGFEAEARRLAAALPIPVALSLEPKLAGDVRLRLGHDLLGFDSDLKKKESL